MTKLLLDQVSPDKSNAASHHKHCITQILKTNGFLTSFTGSQQFPHHALFGFHLDLS